MVDQETSPWASQAQFQNINAESYQCKRQRQLCRRCFNAESNEKTKICHKGTAAVTKKQNLNRHDLKSRLVWILNDPKEVGLQVVLISNGIWNPESKPFEISKFAMVETLAKARPFENQTIWNLTLKKSGFQMLLDFKWSDFRSPLYLQ